MKNLHQIRAANALAFSKLGAVSGEDDGEVIKKIPPLILNHGLLATCAYAFNEKKKAWQVTFDKLAEHLADKEIALVPMDCRSHQQLMEFLTGPNATSETLKLATAEAMAWLDYARRFVSKDGHKDIAR